MNEAPRIATTVAHARRQYGFETVEIIVVDGGSRDRTLAELAGFGPSVQVVRSRAGRARQLNEGAQRAGGPVLVFCHADTSLPEGWLEAVEGALARPEVGGGAFQPEFRPAWGLLRLLNLPPPLRWPGHWLLMYGDQGQFARQKVFEEVGGFPDIPLMEDLELARRLATRARLVRLPLRVRTSSRRFAARGVLRQEFLNVRLVLRYLLGSGNAARLAARYHNSAPSGSAPSGSGDRPRT